MSGKLFQVVSALTQALTLSLALFLAVGGCMGFYFAQSLPSLIGGLTSGALLAAASLKNPRSATSRAAVLLTTTFVSGFFSLRYLRTGKTFPAGLGAGACASVALLQLVLLSAGAGGQKKPKNN